MPGLSLRRQHVRFSRFGLGLLLAAFSTVACGGWRLPPPHEVHAMPDPSASYLVVLDTLKTEHYTILEQDAAKRSVRVRSHVDEKSAARVSTILLHVDNGVVYLSGSGYLVRPDGTTHHALISEMAALDQALQKKFGGSPASTASPS